ncbi:polyprenyl synthetase family protein [Akkermansia glycaniphila]|uniref:Polyprenyl synthetase n=1 Tax=Akkermansia glycaniphila TaxID=1679444 RepID=A0A1C7PE28_9BACT|nr:farnesyl diphosphate synthase [Akkermansia glycaniphila]OCA03843.1 farnesyl-diphosphate synthase [Akkermansia glycaniphila]SEH69404.1 polyprenyl synthetase [Akkermansia glycaniphila]
MTIREYIAATAEQVDQALDSMLPPDTASPATIHQAMRYSIFAGGKRIRPVLCIAAAEACGGNAATAMPAACAVETLHTYTLIHDDLPCMDNDDLRRGKPTNHKVFGEGIAVLAGDALLTEAFAMLARLPENASYSVADYVRELAEATGSRQLIGGQVLDLEGEGRQLTIEELRAIHNGKTSALLTAAIRLGAMSAAAASEQLAALTAYGQNLGLAFQIIDDILDITSTPETLGKSIGKDEQAGKATYPALVGIDHARQEARDLTVAACKALDIFPEQQRTRLLALNDYLLNRNY